MQKKFILIVSSDYEYIEKFYLSLEDIQQMLVKEWERYDSDSKRFAPLPALFKTLEEYSNTYGPCHVTLVQWAESAKIGDDTEWNGQIFIRVQ